MDDPSSSRTIEGGTRAAEWPGGGEAGARICEIDWSKTKLGPRERWPASLKTLLGAILGSRFPMLLWWGPDLLHFYNDAVLPILSDKHPGALGAPAEQVWREAWAVAGPMAASVQAGGPATWAEDLQLFIRRAGIAEESYFTFSFSPAPEGAGIGGVLITVQETTAKVRSERQIRMLHELATRASNAKCEEDAYRLSLQVLEGNEPDLPFVLLYTVHREERVARLAGQSGWAGYQGAARADRVLLTGGPDSGAWPLAEAAETGQTVIVDDLARRFGPLPADRWNGRVERAIVIPLCRGGQSAPYALLICGISPHRPFDEWYQTFFRATADQVMAIVEHAGAYDRERKRAEGLAEIDRAKTAFFSNVSHEFRTPLTLMLGPLEDVLRAGGIPEPHREQVETAYRNSLRLLKRVNALLDFSRIEGGRAQALCQPTDLAASAGRRSRIVWADDNADMRRYVTRLLETSYEIVEACDGQAALEAIRAAPPDLVLSDVMMPRLDGFGLLEALRADERTRRMPVILLSARAGEEAFVAGFDAGADDYLIKPFSARELLARVRTHLDLASRRRQWESQLEQRVAERTADLAATTRRLTAENSRREAAERRLQTAYDDLRRTQRTLLQQERLRALGQMASGIAHDINNAISPAALYVETLLESDPTLSARARQHLPAVLRAIGDVEATVDRMREFYRTREHEATLISVDLNDLIEQTIELTRARWHDMPLRRGIVITVVHELARPLASVLGIESEIRMALTNLIFNAVDAMPQGGTLTLRTRELPAVQGADRTLHPQPSVCLEVADTGIGMDEKTSSRCLEPFFTTKGERGTGLGLAMVYGVARRHDADIGIESAPGRGTAIRVTFPVPIVARASRAHEEPAEAALKQLRVLLIDDDPLVLKSLSDTLEAEGHVVVIAADSRHGVDAFRRALLTEPFSAVITDLGMPHVDGYGVAKAVKESSPLTPVILLTGWGRRLDSERDMPPNIDRLLAKPPKLRELRAALAECCSERERDRDGTDAIDSAS